MSKPPSKPRQASFEAPELRKDRRRSVYFGENITCSISSGNMVHKVEIIDISPYGLAFVNRSFRVLLKFQIGERICLEFEKKEGKFSVKGQIVSVGEMMIQQTKRQRFGVQFDLQNWSTYPEFDQGLAKPLVLAKTHIRPQLTCKDSFFFNELVLFQINGFAADGIDVVTSSRWKSIVPGQLLQLDIFLPGFGLFHIKCRNSNHIHRSTRLNRLRLFLQYEKRNVAMEQSICEYLLLINADATPQKLRQAGFQLNQLDQSCEFQYPVKALPQLSPVDFSSTAFAIPNFSQRVVAEQFQNRSRKVVGKVGFHQMAFFRLVFFEEGQNLSELQALGYQIPLKYLVSTRLEVAHLLLSSEVRLTDIFVPMMKHIVRIAAQSKSRFLMVDCKPIMKKVMETIGFVVITKNINRIDEYGESSEMLLMALEVNVSLQNKFFEIDTKIWDKFYKDLSEFLGRRPPPAKTIKPFSFQ